MDALGEYVQAVTAAALLWGIGAGLLPEGTPRELVRLFCAIAMTITILTPLSRIDLTQVLQQSIPAVADWDDFSAKGEAMAKEASAQLIKSRTEAYILDKAEDLNAAITAEVTVSSDSIPVPSRVRIRGAVSPYVRRQLETVLCEELGIPKEEQIWIS